MVASRLAFIGVLAVVIFAELAVYRLARAAVPTSYLIAEGVVSALAGLAILAWCAARYAAMPAPGVGGEAAGADYDRALAETSLLAVGGALLLPPGLLTDGIGLAMLLPAVRRRLATGFWPLLDRLLP